jgi:hypothetical protein
MWKFSVIVKMLNTHSMRGAFAVGFIGFATSGWAVPILSSPTIISGDKTFNSFTCNVSTGGPPLTCTALAINVDAHTSAPPQIPQRETSASG